MDCVDAAKDVALGDRAVKGQDSRRVRCAF